MNSSVALLLNAKHIKYYLIHYMYAKHKAEYSFVDSNLYTNVKHNLPCMLSIKQLS